MCEKDGGKNSNKDGKNFCIFAIISLVSQNPQKDVIQGWKCGTYVRASSFIFDIFNDKMSKYFWFFRFESPYAFENVLGENKFQEKARIIPN